MNDELSQADAGILAAPLSVRFQNAPVLPRILVAPARAMYIGPGLQLAPHHNVAATLAVALEAPFELRTWSGRSGWTDWRASHCALIPSETLHHLRSRGAMAFLYMDPLTDRRHALTQAQLDAGRTRLLAHGPRIGIHAAFASFGLQPAVPRDARIARVVQAIERQPDAFPHIQDAARLACLSPSRFRARFDAELGLPFRRYRLWRRMALVMRALAGGSNLTTAAQEAGFASSAHLSTTFKQLFGLAPSEVMALGVVIDVSGDGPDAPQAAAALATWL